MFIYLNKILLLIEFKDPNVPKKGYRNKVVTENDPEY